MKLNADLIKRLSKTFEPSTLLHDRFRGNDISFNTDAAGHVMQLFVGKRTTAGDIKGERYMRMLLFDAAGKPLKDHWDHKGKASGA